MTTQFKTMPYKAVDMNRKAVEAALANAGSLIADIKEDGVRGEFLLIPQEDNVNIVEGLWVSRVDKNIPAIEHLNHMGYESILDDSNCLHRMEGMMVDGELLVKGVDFNTSSGLLRTKWLKETNLEFHDSDNYPVLRNAKGKLEAKQPFRLDPAKLLYVVYGVVPLDVIESGSDYNVMNCLMQEHVKAMVPVLQKHLPSIEVSASTSFEVYSMEALDQLFSEVREQGHEGLVVKDPLDIYKRGKKSGWWKMKPENEADGVVVGLNWGTVGLANEGKVIGFEVLLESGRVVSANNISQALMKEFTEAVAEASGGLTLKEIALIYNEPDAVINNPYEGWQCQIAYMEETPDGSLRHPSWVMWRGTESDPTVKM